MYLEWLWLILCVVGLVALWMLIVGLERLVNYVKSNDRALRKASKSTQSKVETEEENFLRVQDARDYIEKTQLDPLPEEGKVPEEFKNALSVLSSDELFDAIVNKVFGDKRDSEGIKASQSALEKEPATLVVAKGGNVSPVKAKSALSKQEQKMLKKIKRGS